MFKNISHVSVSESNLLCHCLSYEQNCGVAGDRKEKRRKMFNTFLTKRIKMAAKKV